MGQRNADGSINTAYYTTKIANPLQGLIPNNASLNGGTIARELLLRPYPQYGSIQLQNAPIGRQRYDSAQFKLTKRFGGGLTFLASYVIAKTLEQANVYNNQDYVIADASATRLEKRSAGEIDIPQKFSIAGVWDLPVGRNKPFGTNMGRAADLILGGWQFNWNVTYSRGWTLDYPNALQAVAGSAQLSQLGPNLEIWDTSLWNQADGTRVKALSPYELRTFQTRFGDVRTPGYQNWDASLAKFFPITEQVRLQFRFEMVNAMNHPWISNPQSNATNVSSAQFGTLRPTQDNLPRFIKLGLMLRW
jgi:hypothetical protein